DATAAPQRRRRLLWHAKKLKSMTAGAGNKATSGAPWRSTGKNIWSSARLLWSRARRITTSAPPRKTGTGTARSSDWYAKPTAERGRCTPGNLSRRMASDSSSNTSTKGFGADQDSTTVTKLEGHAELVTELVNPLL